MYRKWMIAFALIVILGAFTLIAINNVPVQGVVSTPTNGRVVPTLGGSTNDWQKTVVVGVDNPRLIELSRVLCISMDELKKLSPDQIDQLIRQNAEKLGVKVYENTTDSTGKESPMLVAGTSVFKPETCKTPEP